MVACQLVFQQLIRRYNKVVMIGLLNVSKLKLHAFRQVSMPQKRHFKIYAISRNMSNIIALAFHIPSLQ